MKNIRFFVIALTLIFAIGWANRIIVKDNVPPFKGGEVLDEIRNTPVVGTIRQVREALAIY